MISRCLGYESLPSEPSNSQCCGLDWSWFWSYLKGGELSQDEKNALVDRMHEMKGADNVETFEIHAESVRQIAYVMFWIKILFAAIFTKIMVDPSTIVHSDLKNMFGYNNVRKYILLRTTECLRHA
jgi:hypothetical protein